MKRLILESCLKVKMRASLTQIIFTLFQICWAIVWAHKHIRARSGRHYSDNRTQADTNNRYRVVSYFLYGAQNILCIASFWTRSPLLLEIHNSDALRVVGVMLVVLATVLYFESLRYLGKNYSPCFDAHLPFKLVVTGPYRFVRHPMYLAKLIVAIGNFVLSGSLWFVPMFLYLLWETARTIVIEEKYLAGSISGYAEYKRRTPQVVPTDLIRN